MLPDPEWKAKDQRGAWNGIPRTRVRFKVEMHVFHINRIELEPLQATTMIMTTKLVICLVGCSKGSPTEEKLRIETQRRSQPRSRRMITVLHKMSKSKKAFSEGKCVARLVLMRAQVKSDKVHPLKVKEAISSFDKSTIENLQKKGSTLRNALIASRKTVSERTMLESSS